jgi:hypothetical protein
MMFLFEDRGGGNKSSAAPWEKNSTNLIQSKYTLGQQGTRPTGSCPLMKKKSEVAAKRLRRE